MSKFDKDKLQDFLAVCSKYMKLRDISTQKQLADEIDVGVSTMSRFMSMKVTDIDDVLVAKIVAKLAIPPMEIADFVEEDYTDQFLRLVRAFREGPAPSNEQAQAQGSPAKAPAQTATSSVGTENDFDAAIIATLGVGTRNANANVNIGGRKATVPFRADEGGRSSADTLQNKLAELTPRQKAYMTDFLHLDIEGRDLIVDLGNELFRYFRQKGLIS